MSISAAGVVSWPAPVAGFINNPAVQPTINNMFPFYNGLKNGYYRNQNISRTGYLERDVADYDTKSLKLNAALHWRINDKVEAIFQGNVGSGTTVYTGADRYSITNFMLSQYKIPNSCWVTKAADCNNKKAIEKLTKMFLSLIIFNCLKHLINQFHIN